jgi:hypothetical protein
VSAGPAGGNRIAVLCEAGEALLLQGVFGPEARGVRAADFEQNGFSNQRVIWLDPHDLDKPSDADQDAVEAWEKLIHLVTSRLFVQLVRLGSQARSQVAEVLAWRKRFVDISREIQSHVRAYRNVLILVFERPPRADEIQGLLDGLSGFAVYIMMPQLRVAVDAPRLPHARHVWHFAVARLLSRLLTHECPEPGFYAWRALQIQDKDLSGHLRSLARKDLEAFFGWLQSQQPWDGAHGPPHWPTPQTDGAPIPPPQVWKTMADGLSQNIPVPNTAETEAVLGSFTKLASGDAPRLVAEITDPDSVTKQASETGRLWRLEHADHPRKLWEIESKQRGWWRKLTETPSEGGMGFLNQIALAMSRQLERFRLQPLVDVQLARWGDALKTDADFHQQRQILDGWARELQKARDHMVGLTKRVFLGSFCAVIVGFILAQAMRCWSGFWWAGKSFGLIPAREMGLLIALTVCGALGVAAGVVLPYYLERRAGLRAAKELCMRATDLQQRMVKRVNDRLRLCHVARVLAVTNDYLGGYFNAKQIASRAANIVKAELNSHLGGGVLTPPNAEVDEKNFDQRAYHDVSTLEVSSGASSGMARTDENEAPDNLERIRLECYEVWQENIARIDFKETGWLPQAEIARTLDSMVSRFLAKMSERYRDEALKALQDVGELERIGALVEDGLERWHLSTAQARGHMPMLSLHVNLYADGNNDFRVRTLVSTRFENVLAQLRQRSMFKKLEPEPAEVEPLSAPGVIMDVFQELPVSFDKNDANTKGFAWFDPSTTRESR